MHTEPGGKLPANLPSLYSEIITLGWKDKGRRYKETYEIGFSFFRESNLGIGFLLNHRCGRDNCRLTGVKIGVELWLQMELGL